jgi:hypothetical protein
MFRGEDCGTVWYFYYTGLIPGYADKVLSKGFEDIWTLDTNISNGEECLSYDDELSFVLHDDLDHLLKLLSEGDVQDFRIGAAIELDSEQPPDIELLSKSIESSSGRLNPEFLGFEVSADGFYSGLLNVCGMDHFDGQIPNLNQYGLFEDFHSAASFQDFLDLEVEGHTFTIFALWKL